MWPEFKDNGEVMIILYCVAGYMYFFYFQNRKFYIYLDMIKVIPK
jgi:hypothetical protein